MIWLVGCSLGNQQFETIKYNRKFGTFIVKPLGETSSSSSGFPRHAAHAATTCLFPRHGWWESLPNTLIIDGYNQGFQGRFSHQLIQWFLQHVSPHFWIGVTNNCGEMLLLILLLLQECCGGVVSSALTQRDCFSNHGIQTTFKPSFAVWWHSTFT